MRGNEGRLVPYLGDQEVLSMDTCVLIISHGMKTIGDGPDNGPHWAAVYFPVHHKHYYEVGS